MIKVIINADDLGASQMVNKAIFDLMEKGKVKSATIISNSPYFYHAIKYA